MKGAAAQCTVRGGGGSHGTGGVIHDGEEVSMAIGQLGGEGAEGPLDPCEYEACLWELNVTRGWYTWWIFLVIFSNFNKN